MACRSWWLNNGSTADINYAIIKNGFIGLQCDVFPTPAAQDHLFLSNTIIKNMSGFGLLSYDYKIKGWNYVIANCGSYCCALTGGGNYEFLHCTMANYWKNSQRSTPAVYLNNYIAKASSNEIHDLTKADFDNCIIYGALDDELQVDTLHINTAIINFRFDHCAIKAKETSTSGSHFIVPFRNYDPMFKDESTNNYEVNSSNLNVGDPAFLVGGLTDFDIKGKQRSTTIPTLGAYEK